MSCVYQGVVISLFFHMAPSYLTLSFIKHYPGNLAGDWRFSG